MRRETGCFLPAQRLYRMMRIDQAAPGLHPHGAIHSSHLGMIYRMLFRRNSAQRTGACAFVVIGTRLEPLRSMSCLSLMVDARRRERGLGPHVYQFPWIEKTSQASRRADGRRDASDCLPRAVLWSSVTLGPLVIVIVIVIS